MVHYVLVRSNHLLEFKGVNLSCSEAEYAAMSAAVKEIGCVLTSGESGNPS
jgi:hypothetical protein